MACDPRVPDLEYSVKWLNKRVELLERQVQELLKFKGSVEGGAELPPIFRSNQATRE